MTEIYRVKSGESLSSIARDLLGDIKRWPEIAFANGLSHPYFIYVGQVLELPPESGGDIVEVEKAAVAPIAQTAGFTFSPATVFLLVVGAALFFFNRSK